VNSRKMQALKYPCSSVGNPLPHRRDMSLQRRWTAAPRTPPCVIRWLRRKRRTMKAATSLVAVAAQPAFLSSCRLSLPVTAFLAVR